MQEAVGGGMDLQLASSSLACGGTGSGGAVTAGQVAGGHVAGGRHRYKGTTGSRKSSPYHPQLLPPLHSNRGMNLKTPSTNQILYKENSNKFKILHVQNLIIRRVILNLK